MAKHYTKYLTVDGVRYRITKRKLPNERSNYNCMINIFAMNETLPLIGFPVKESYLINNNIDQIKTDIKEFNNDGFTIFR